MTTIYIQNRCPHKILNNMTLKEAFTRNKLNVDHLIIFGCLIYIHISRYKRKKLYPTGMKGMFVGYNTSSKNLHQGRIPIEVSIDFIFDESIAYKKYKDIPIDSDKKDLYFPMKRVHGKTILQNLQSIKMKN